MAVLFGLLKINTVAYSHLILTYALHHAIRVYFGKSGRWQNLKTVNAIDQQ